MYEVRLHWTELGARNAICPPTYCVLIRSAEVLDWLVFGRCYTISKPDGDPLDLSKARGNREVFYTNMIDRAHSTSKLVFSLTRMAVETVCRNGG